MYEAAKSPFFLSFMSNKKCYVFGKHLIIYKILGAGGMAYIVKAHDIRTGIDVAAKIRAELVRNSKRGSQLSLNEYRMCETMKYFRHLNLLHYYGTYKDLFLDLKLKQNPSPLYPLILELVDIDLREWLINKGGKVEINDESKYILYDIVCGMKVLLDKFSIVHCDLKCSNIMLKQMNGRLVAKIGDFGNGYFLKLKDKNGIRINGPMAIQTATILPQECKEIDYYIISKTLD
eukprot:194781_1